MPGIPATWESWHCRGLRGTTQHQPKLREARCTKQGRTALEESSVLAAQEGSAAGGQLGGLRQGLLSSHLSTMEQPSRVVP